MSVYKVYPAFDVALVDLDTIVPQPRSKGVSYTRTTRAADGSQLQEGPFVVLEWTALEDETQYTTLIDQFGVLNSLTSPVTIYCRGETFGFTRYNGIASRPEVGKSLDWQYRPKNISITITNLEQLVEP